MKWADDAPESGTSSSPWPAHWWASWWFPHSWPPLWTSVNCNLCVSACHLLTRTGGTSDISDTWSLENSRGFDDKLTGTYVDMNVSSDVGFDPETEAECLLFLLPPCVPHWPPSVYVRSNRILTSPKLAPSGRLAGFPQCDRWSSNLLLDWRDRKTLKGWVF